MFYSKRETRKGNPLPSWHYESMDGSLVWLSEDHEEIALKRFVRVCKANDVSEKAMRYCHNCEVGIGVMPQERYRRQNIQSKQICPSCGKSAYGVPKIREESDTIKRSPEFRRLELMLSDFVLRNNG